jgi:hypothetical protein
MFCQGIQSIICEQFILFRCLGRIKSLLALLLCYVLCRVCRVGGRFLIERVKYCIWDCNFPDDSMRYEMPFTF